MEGGEENEYTSLKESPTKSDMVWFPTHSALPTGHGHGELCHFFPA